MSNFKISFDEILVIKEDEKLEFGKAKLSYSINEPLNNKTLTLSVGIKNLPQKPTKQQRVNDVLMNFITFIDKLILYNERAFHYLEYQKEITL